MTTSERNMHNAILLGDKFVQLKTQCFYMERGCRNGCQKQEATKKFGGSNLQLSCEDERFIMCHFDREFMSGIGWQFSWCNLYHGTCLYQFVGSGTDQGLSQTSCFTRDRGCDDDWWNFWQLLQGGAITHFKCAWCFLVCVLGSAGVTHTSAMSTTVVLDALAHLQEEAEVLCTWAILHGASSRKAQCIVGLLNVKQMCTLLLPPSTYKTVGSLDYLATFFIDTCHIFK